METGLDFAFIIPMLEIEKDIERLNLITDRFSKVGSSKRRGISLDEARKWLNPNLAEESNEIEKKK